MSPLCKARDHRAVAALSRYSLAELEQMEKGLKNLAAAYREAFRVMPGQIRVAQCRVHEAMLLRGLDAPIDKSAQPAEMGP